VTSEPTDTPREKKVSHWILPLVLVLILLLGVVSGVHLILTSISSFPGRVIESTSDAGAQALERVADAVRSVLQVEPEITVASRVVQQQSAPIAELALIEREFPLTLNWGNKFLGSTKAMVVSGTFTAKAGYDLEKNFQITWAPPTGPVTVRLPEPEILSIELHDDLSLDGKSGWWNRLSDEDRNEVLVVFQQAGRDAIDQSLLREEVIEETRKRIASLAGDQPFSIEWDFYPPRGSLEAGPGSLP